MAKGNSHDHMMITMGIIYIASRPITVVDHLDPGPIVGHAFVSLCAHCRRRSINDHKHYYTTCQYCGSDEVSVFQDMSLPVYGDL